MTQPAKKEKFHVTVVGRGGAGKSQFVRMLLAMEFQEKSHANAGHEYCMNSQNMKSDVRAIVEDIFRDTGKTVPEIALTLHDAAGQIEFQDETDENIVQSDTVYIVVDWRREKVVEETKEWIDRVNDIDERRSLKCAKEGKMYCPMEIVIVVTKCDLVQHESPEKQAENKRKIKDIKRGLTDYLVFCISPKTQQGATEVIKHFYTDIYYTARILRSPSDKNMSYVGHELPTKKKKSTRRCIVM